MAVSFVAFDERFLEASWVWLQDEELRKLIHATPVTKQQQQAWFHQLASRTDYHIWGVTYNDAPVGVSGIKHIHEGSGEYWGYIGDKSCWGKGIGKEMLQLAEQKAKRLCLQQLTLQVLTDNIRAIKLYQHAGFEVVDTGNSFLLMQKKLA